MAHKEQKRFCKLVKKKYRHMFYKSYVLDVGSLDINGNNRYLFSRCDYKGIDITPGKNVDIVESCKDFLSMFNPPRKYTKLKHFDTIVCTEMLEHDKTWKESLQSMYDGLRDGGLLLITCAGDGRKEHGTTNNHAWASPATNDYYKNISNEMFNEILKPNMFLAYHLEQSSGDLYFYGIKN
jgi:SAM-dependent methyltransferase